MPNLKQMADKQKKAIFSSSSLLLLILIPIGYAGNYFSYPFGFGVDFLFGSIATVIVIALYGIWWGTLASLVASSYTIVLWQHPYALIIFVCEALFLGWRVRQRRKNLLTSDMIFWVCVGIPLVLLFYGYILKVGVITTSIIALKQPVNGIFNTLVASLLLSSKPVYSLANSAPKKSTVYFERILLNLLVAAVLIPALTLMVVNNRTAMKHEQDTLIATLDASAHNLAGDLRRWHQSGLEALRFLAQTSSQSQIIVSGQTQHSLDLAVDSFPLFKEIYIINADRKIIANTAMPEESAVKLLDFSGLRLPRIPQIFTVSSPQSDSGLTSPDILQTLPIILSDRWLGNIIAELNTGFLERLLATEAHAVPLRSTLMDKNRLLIASTNKELKGQQKYTRPEGEIEQIESASSQQNIYHWLPLLEGKPLIARWRESFYAEELTIDEEIPWVLCMEAPAAPYIDYLQLLYIRSLAILLAIALVSILIARFLSRILVKPILRLATFTTNLPYKILRNERISIPRSSIIEMNALVDNFETMSGAIEENFLQIKLTNQKLKQAKDKSEVANKAKDKFLANISHELKTPLNSIVGYSRLVQKKLNSRDERTKNLEEVKSLEWLDNVQQDSKYLLALINEILDLAKSQAHKTKLYPSLVTVSDFMEDIILTGRRKVAEKDIIFEFETIGKLPVNIYVDEQRLRQVLLYLLDNAVKYTERGQIVLQVSQVNVTKAEERVEEAGVLQNLPEHICLRFKVTDTGIGIERQNLTRIFQPFEQVDKYEVPEVGIGLGLSISKQLVELMGGELQVKSELGQGSSFWFDLVCPEIKVSSTVEADSVREIVGYDGDRLTLLVVDDVKTSRLLLQDILEPLGFKVIVAKNGQQGLQLALEHQPDLILTDLFMPIKTGFSLIAELRQNDTFARTPIIAVSASTFEEVERHSRASGCNDFLEKPISDRKLLMLLGKHLNLEWIYRYSQTRQLHGRN